MSDTFVPPAENHQGLILTPANNLEELVPINGTKSPRSQWYRLETDRKTITDISDYSIILNTDYTTPEILSTSYSNHVWTLRFTSGNDEVKFYNITDKSGFTTTSGTITSISNDIDNDIAITFQNPTPGFTTVSYDGTGNMVTQNGIPVLPFSVDLSLVG